MSKTPFFVSFVCPRSVTLSIRVYRIYDLSAKDLCEKHAQRKVVLQHKSALFTQGGSSGSRQNELGSHPPPQLCLPPGQPAGPPLAAESHSPLSAH